MAENTSESVETLRARLEKAVDEFEKFTNGTVKPLAQKSAEQAGKATQVAKDRFYTDVVPSAVAAVGTAKALLEALKDVPTNQKVRESVQRRLVQEPEPEPRKHHTGRYVLLGLATTAVVGVGVAVARAVTLADEHWIGIDDEFDENQQ